MVSAILHYADLVTRNLVSHFTMSRGESIGLALDTEAGLFSTIASFIILLLISRRIYMDRQWEAMDISVIALFVAEVVQGLGHTVSLKWVIEGEVNTGTFCTAQAVMQQLGETSVALATLTIAVQTFVTIWWLKAPSKLVTSIFVAIQWLFVILFVGIGFGENTHAPSKYYATPTPYWCWIGQNYNKERIAGEYFWFWLTLGVSIALYLPLFLLHLGIIEPGPAWYAPSIAVPSESPEEDEDDDYQVESKALSRTPPGLWTAIVYPMVYCVLILPLSAVRWISFRQIATTGESHISAVSTFTVSILFSLSGILNTVMYLLTRAWFFSPQKRDELEAPNVEPVRA